jgi:hypothetical protein
MSKSKQASHDGFVFPPIPEAVSGMLHPYQDRFLADDILTDIDVLLLSIYMLETARRSSGATRENVRSLFVQLGRNADTSFRTALFKAKKESYLEEGEKGVLLFKILGIKRLEQITGQVGKSPIRLLRAGQNLTAIKLFEEFLKTEVSGEEINLCDPHVSPSTLYPFTVLAGVTTAIRILTSTIYEGDKLANYLEKFRKQTGISVGVRKSFEIHDRYLISDQKCWSIGASIKDFGNKDTIITEMTGILLSLNELFEDRWSGAKII